MRTEFRPASFPILPTVIKNLLIINVLVFIAQVAFDHIQTGSSSLDVNSGIMSDTFALHTYQSPLFKPWQLITHMFMHADLTHIFFNMYALWMFGSVLESVWGPGRFLTFYLVCGIGAAVCHMVPLYFDAQHIVDIYKTMPIEQQQNPDMIDALNEAISAPTRGASGAVFGCLAAFAYLFPNTSLQVIFIPISFKAKWFVLVYAAIELLLAIRNNPGDNIAHVAHLGGALVGFLLVLFWNKPNKKPFY